MKKIFIILSLFSFLSLAVFAQKTEVNENFDELDNWAESGWTTTGSWAISTNSLY